MFGIQLTTHELHRSSPPICSDPRYTVGGKFEELLDYVAGRSLTRILGGGSELPGILMYNGASAKTAFDSANAYHSKYNSGHFTHNHGDKPYCRGCVGCGWMGELSHHIGDDRVIELQEQIDNSAQRNRVHNTILYGPFNPRALIINDSPELTVNSENVVVIDRELHNRQLRDFSWGGYLRPLHISKDNLLYASKLLMNSTISHLLSNVPHFTVKYSRKGEPQLIQATSAIY